jgi:hypothetical protein
MRTSAALALTAGLGLSGCAMLGALLSLADISLLGAMPADGFADAGSADQGKVIFAIGGQDPSGMGIIPPLDFLEVEDEDGEPVEIEDGEEVEGHTAGSFVLLIDGSGSMESMSPDCANCPTDPQRFRVEAARVLSKKLGACGPDWRQALMEFSTEAWDDSFDSTRVLAGFDAGPEQLPIAADQLGSYGGTPVWDSTYEVLESLNQDAAEGFSAAEFGDSGAPGEGDYGTGLVVVSDGTDTSSRRSLNELIGRANALGVSVHTIGLGPASDAVEEFGAQDDAIEDLRRLAKETGGYYGYVSTADELPALADAIAKATCGGYQEMTARFATPRQHGERVNGRIKLKNTDIGVPFTFRAP